LFVSEPETYRTGRFRAVFGPALDIARAVVLGAAVIASALTLGAGFKSSPGAQIALLSLVAVFAYLAASRRRRSIDLTAQCLQAFADGGDAPDLSQRKGGSDGKLLVAVAALVGRLEALRLRISKAHPITALPAREFFVDGVNAAVAAATGGMVGLVRFADYDRLAAFDSQAADAALGKIAQRLEGALGRDRPRAQVDRDTFALWFGADADPGERANELRAIAYVLRQELDVGAQKITPDIRIGAAVSPDDGRDADTLLARAGAALASSGQTEGGKVTLFSRNSTEARERYSFEQNLRHAIARDEFLLHFQPVVDVAAGRVVGAEALLRWHHSALGMVPPSKFIAIAEDAGLMNEVGIWVLNTACREAKIWQENGLTDLKLAVNLSGRQLRDPALNRVIVRTLERHGLEAGSLELELTETAAMEDSSRTRELFEQLRSLGVGVAIDDFGIGYSSLSYLKNLPFSKLKIDREFVSSVDTRQDSRAICSALVELCRGLDITVLAEGVECGGEVEALRTLGCSMFQGFFFSKPVPGPEFLRTVRDRSWLPPAPQPRPAKRRATAGAAP
jgi:predicted signal transduction protein with EAL and GGDEF domain